MSHKPLVVYCLCEINCPLYDVVKEAYRMGVEQRDVSDGQSVDESLSTTSLALRVLRVNMGVDNYVEVWARVSGYKHIVECFDKVLRRAKGVYYQLICSNKFSKVLRILISRDKCGECAPQPWCKACPLVSAPAGAMAKTTVITPRGILYEFIVARKAVYEEIVSYGCKPVLIHSIDEYDYMLTERQEYALISAYMLGYYSFPRKISLKDLATKLGLSVSTLAELLRRAEAKVVDAFVRHELPHYIVENVFRRGSSTAASIINSREKQTKPKTLPTVA